MDTNKEQNFIYFEIILNLKFYFMKRREKITERKLNLVDKVKDSEICKERITEIDCLTRNKKRKKKIRI